MRNNNFVNTLTTPDFLVVFQWLMLSTFFLNICKKYKCQLICDWFWTKMNWLFQKQGKYIYNFLQKHIEWSSFLISFTISFTKLSITWETVIYDDIFSFYYALRSIKMHSMNSIFYVCFFLCVCFNNKFKHLLGYNLLF